MSVVTVRPDTTNSLSGLAVTGAGGDLDTALSDDNGATFVGGLGGSLSVDFADPTIDPGDTVYAVVARAKVATTGGDAIFGAGISGSVAGHAFNILATPTVTTQNLVSWYTSDNPTSATLTLTALGYGFGGAQATVNIYELYLDVYTFDQPVVSITAPTGTVTASNLPLAEWTPTLDTRRGSQSHYRVKVFTDDQHDAGGFDEDTTDPVQDSGIVQSADTSWRPSELLEDDDYHYYVQIAQEVGGELYWSDWDSIEFTLDVDLAAPAEFEVTAEDGLGRLRLEVTGPDSGDADPDLFEVERRDTPEDEWVDLRTLLGDGLVEFDASSDTRTNKITNPSFETNVSNWTAINGATLTRVTDDAAPGAGLSAMKVAGTSTTGSGGISNAGAAAANDWVLASVYLKGNVGGEIVDITPIFFNNVGGALSSTLKTVTLTTSWQRFTVLSKAPATTASVWLYLTKNASAGAQTFFADAAQVQIVSTSQFDKPADPVLEDAYSGKGTGALTTADTGQAWSTWATVVGGGPQLVSDKLTITKVCFGHAQTRPEPGRKVTRIGASTTFSSYSTLFGALGVIVWARPIVAADYSGIFPNSPFHFILSPFNWSVQIIENDVSTTIASGNFSPALATDDSTVHSVTITFYDDGVAWIKLPDGTYKRVEDERITRLAGEYVDFEPTQSASTDSKAKLTEVWADTTPNGVEPGSYFDGTTAGADWSGTAHGSTSIWAPPFFATAYDYEAANGEEALYRVRSIADNGGGDYAVSDWVEGSGEWSSTQAWLKHPTDPTLNLSVRITSYPSQARAARTGFHQALGADSVLAVTDTRGPVTGSLSLMVDDDAARAALDALVEDGSPLLLQTADGDAWPDRWIVLGDLARALIADKSWIEPTFDSFPWVEVARPGGDLASWG